MSAISSIKKDLSGDSATATFATSAAMREAVANVAAVAVAKVREFRWCDSISKARAELFAAKGVQPPEIYELVMKLRKRDGEYDDRRLCFECLSFAGVGPWACKSKIGLPGLLPRDFPLLLQRCDGFEGLDVSVYFGGGDTTCINKEKADEQI